MHDMSTALIYDSELEFKAIVGCIVVESLVLLISWLYCEIAKPSAALGSATRT